MDDKQIEAINNTQEKFLESLIRLGKLADSDLNHGNGLFTKKDADENIAEYQKDIDNVLLKFNNLKELLNKIYS